MTYRRHKIQPAGAGPDRIEEISNTVHDLKSPVAVLLGYAQLLRSGAAGPVTDRQSLYLDSMSTSCWVISYLLENYRLRETVRNGLQPVWDEAGDVLPILNLPASRLKRAFEVKSAKVIVNATSRFVRRGSRLLETAASALLLTAIHTSAEDSDIVLDAHDKSNQLVLSLRSPGVVGPGPLDVIPLWSEYLISVGGGASISPGQFELVIPGALLD